MKWNDLFSTTPSDNIEESHDVCVSGQRLVPLEDHRLILVSGQDTIKFLQGQLTCDLAKLDEAQSLLGAHCSPKGRMISSFLAASLNDDTEKSTKTVGLRVHASIAETALAALQKYAVFSKVKLELSDAHFIFALQGDIEKLEALPDSSQFKAEDKYTALRTAADQCEFWCRKDSLSALLNLFPEAAPQDSSRLWRLKNIQRGIAVIEANLQDQLLPQEINFQLTEGISFSKGCYTGQEIIARLHYRGQLKKHMRRACIESETAPISGQAVFSTKKNVGMIINVAQSAATRFECLALCDDKPFDDDLAGTDALQINPESPVNLQWLPLPYAIK